MSEPEHYARRTSPTHHLNPEAVDTPATRIWAILARTPFHPDSPDPARAHEQAAADQARGAGLLADAVQIAETINRDEHGRFATAETSPSRRLTGGSTGLATVPAEPATPLQRIRDRLGRQYDEHVPDGYTPPAS